MLSFIRQGINEWHITVARKLISSNVDSIMPDGMSLSILLLQNQEVILLLFYCHLKSFVKIAVPLMYIKPGSMPVLHNRVGTFAENIMRLSPTAMCRRTPIKKN